MVLGEIVQRSWWCLLGTLPWSRRRGPARIGTEWDSQADLSLSTVWVASVGLSQWGLRLLLIQLRKNRLGIHQLQASLAWGQTEPCRHWGCFCPNGQWESREGQAWRLPWWHRSAALVGSGGGVTLWRLDFLPGRYCGKLRGECTGSWWPICFSAPQWVGTRSMWPTTEKYKNLPFFAQLSMLTTFATHYLWTLSKLQSWGEGFVLNCENIHLYPTRSQRTISPFYRLYKWGKERLEYRGSFTFLRFLKKTWFNHELPMLNAWEVMCLLHVVMFMFAYL